MKFQDSCQYFGVFLITLYVGYCVFWRSIFACAKFVLIVQSTIDVTLYHKLPTCFDSELHHRGNMFLKLWCLKCVSCLNMKCSDTDIKSRETYKILLEMILVLFMFMCWFLVVCAFVMQFIWSSLVMLRVFTLEHAAKRSDVRWMCHHVRISARGWFQSLLL
jgi:hypothetical protein